MPLAIPKLDDRTYKELLDDARARIPVHTPEWTNFNESDPGITLLEVFAFLTESLLYRSNYIPERNRLKFLSLLGVPLQPESSARGIVTINNAKGPLETITLNDSLEVRAGQVPFRTEQGLDVLPIEMRAFYKHTLDHADQDTLAYYNQLYVSYTGNGGPDPASLTLYEPLPFVPDGNRALDLGKETVDGSLWLALLTRSANEIPEQVRKKIGGKTLNLGMVPALDDVSLELAPGGLVNAQGTTLLHYEVPVGGTLPPNAIDRKPEYKTLEPHDTTTNPLVEPTVTQITLPPEGQLTLWDNLEPLEAGADDFPPVLDDTALNDRVVTWLRISVPKGVEARVQWLGINAVMVNQRAHIANESLPDGTGEPDQFVVLSRTPVIPDSVRLTVTTRVSTETWERIEDLTQAGPEVPVQNLRLPPGVRTTVKPRTNVYTLNAESGEIRFGDGTHGKRPPKGAIMRVDYDYSKGLAGNVGPDSITVSPSLPAGLKVTNPVRTWGGAPGETVEEGEKQIARYLQHRDRLVSLADFETITYRTPGVEVGRVEVLSAFNPDTGFGESEPGGAPGAVTVMVIPRHDAAQPDAPRPDRIFLDTICSYLEPRRLVTTEVFLRGPEYIPIWIVVAVKVVPGASVAQTREAVKQQLRQYLSPLPDPSILPTPAEDPVELLAAAPAKRGWPLRKPVVDLELMAVASRVPNILQVSTVLLAQGDRAPESKVDMTRLQLPLVAGITVVSDSDGAAEAMNQLRGTSRPLVKTDDKPRTIAVPVIPEECT